MDLKGLKKAVNKTYNNIPNLRGVQTEIPKLTKLQKLKKAKGFVDIEFFCEEFVSIVSIDKGRHKIQLRDYQREMLRTMDNNNRVVMVTGRQMGKTTTSSMFIIKHILYTKDCVIGIAANKLKIAMKILQEIKEMYKNLPMWIQVPVIEWNKGEIAFANGSRIITSATTADAFRSYTCNVVYCDEIDFVDIDLWSEFTKSILPTVSSSEKAKIIYTSTPNGKRQLYRIYNDAKNGHSNYIPLMYKWDRIEGRDEEWKRNIIADMDTPNKELAFRQEYNCEFVTMSSTFIESSVLERINYSQPIYENDKGFSIYYEPIPGHTYCMGVDVSKGTGGDYSVCVIYDVTNTNKIIEVAVFRSNMISTINFPAIIELLSRYYNNAHTLIENNTYGDGVINQLFYEYEFENMISNDLKKGIGIYTSNKTKQQMLRNFEFYISKGKIEINHYQTLYELTQVVRHDSGAVSAVSGQNDDIFMASIICLYILKLGFINVDHSETINEIKMEAFQTVLV